MYRLIPVFQAYPVHLSATTTQQAAERGVHPEGGATASTVAPPIPSEAYCKRENEDHVMRGAATSFLPTDNNQANGNLPSEPFERKRKLPKSEAEANTRHAKRLNVDTNPGQTRTVYELNLPGPTIIEIAGTTSELAKTKGDLCTALIENEVLHAQIRGLQATKEDHRAALVENQGLHVQIRDLQARFEQIQDRLGDLQDLADTVKKFADDMIVDVSE